MNFISRSVCILFSLLAIQTPVLATSLQQSPFYVNGAYYHLDSKLVMGRIENIYYSGVEQLQGVGVPAKIDTGADTTSIHAINISIHSEHPTFSQLQGEELLEAIANTFGDPASEWWLSSFDTPERNIKATVKFDLVHPRTGELIPLERPLARLSGIQGRGDHGILYRPVVELALSAGDITVNTAVNLTDRSAFSYPILIGKTFLREQAWVDSSYDYLQQEPLARIIGTKETAYLDELPLAVSVSLKNRRTSLHASNIKIDDKKQHVSFEAEGKNQKTKMYSLPLLRMLKIGEHHHPLVNIPISFGQELKHLEVVLRDRSQRSTQLRLGKEALNQYFLIDLSAEYLTDQPLKSAMDVVKQAPLMITPEETLLINDVELPAEPSFSVNTSLLRVKTLKTLERSSSKQTLAAFSATDSQGKVYLFEQAIERNIVVGEVTRPVISPMIKYAGEYHQTEIALEQASSDDPEMLAIGEKFVTGSILINTRTSHILSKRNIVKAGYVEQAKVEDLAISVKLDTGADVSSMHAENLQYFEQDGNTMVTFTYSNAEGLKQQFTREVVDEMVIKARVGEKANSRPVVLMTVKLGEVTEIVKVNLQNRENFSYSMILGKNYLRHGFVVSSDKRFILTPKP
ncbi:RimK/LysX family protein [Agarivorans sp. TSD2052]|uniref:putative ATP-dependent zinc protease n=1 Tax=Agarivorans sp. TSD2052 TaxID=2937286 RepID=UPI00200C9BF3|nr:RimK/LysX family protein [Agarivorans sp. TSD2052]UPW19308.1 RimK/LysX family protein [Agarivorans sp. TSD2052]